MNPALRSPFLPAIAALALAGCATQPPPAPEWKPASAESLQGALTLGRCIELALANDVRAAQWRSRLAAAKAEVDIANAIPNPSFAATWEDVGLRDAAGTHLATAAYGLAFPFLFWLSAARPEVAEAGLKSSGASLAEDRRQLRREIGAAYFDLAAAQRKAAFQQGRIETAAAAQRLTSESLRLGIASRHAAAQAGAESLQARADLDAAANELRAKGLEMAFALGADRPVAVRVADMPASDSTAIGDLPSTGTLPASILERGLAADPSCAKAAADREVAEASLRLAREGALPFPEIQGTAERKNEPDGMGNNFSLDIPIPLFNRREGEIRKALAALEGARADEEQARREALKRIALDWESCLYARRRWLETLAPLIVMRRKLAEESRELFASGAIEYAESLQAQRDLSQAELDGVDARRDCETALWNLECDLTPDAGPPPGAGDDGRKER